MAVTYRRHSRTVRARVVFVFHRGGAENYNSRLRGVFKFDSAATALIKFSRPRLRVINRAKRRRMEKNDWQPLERFVAEEHVVDTLWAFEPGFRRAALHPATEQLATLPLPADHPERCQYLVAETCFGELLNLPRPRFEPVFYHVVIQDLCKAIPSFPPKMAKTVGELFRAMDRLDEELRERLATWMAHHLSCSISVAVGNQFRQ